MQPSGSGHPRAARGLWRDGELRASAADLIWLLERLAAGEPVRINCGGRDYTSPTGAIWGFDRFHERGTRRIRILDPRDPVGGPEASPFDVRLIEIEETVDDPIYRTHRAIVHPDPGVLYRIPLPPGTYGVTLHFSEVEREESGTRVFDVLLEGEAVRTDYDPGRRGFARAETICWEGPVADGHLDLELRAKEGPPQICGIEIEKIR